MRTIPQQVYLIELIMAEARRKAAGRQSLVVPFTAVIMRRLGIRFHST